MHAESPSEEDLSVSVKVRGVHKITLHKDAGKTGVNWQGVGMDASIDLGATRDLYAKSLFTNAVKMPGSDVAHRYDLASDEDIQKAVQWSVLPELPADKTGLPDLSDRNPDQYDPTCVSLVKAEDKATLKAEKSGKWAIVMASNGAAKAYSIIAPVFEVTSIEVFDATDAPVAKYSSIEMNTKNTTSMTFHTRVNEGASPSLVWSATNKHRLISTTVPDEHAERSDWQGTVPDGQIEFHAVPTSPGVYQAGPASITVRTLDNQVNMIQHTFSIMVVVPPTKIEVDSPTLIMNAGKSATPKVTVSPATATQDVVWSVNDPTVASISYGKINALNNGTTTITIASKADPTIKAEIALTVSGENIPVQELVRTDYMDITKTADFDAVFANPVMLTTYNFAHPDVLKPAIYNPNTPGCEKTVEDLSQAFRVEPATVYNTLAAKIEVNVGETIDLSGMSLTVAPSDAFQTVCFESTNPKVATFDMNGDNSVSGDEIAARKLRAVSPGVTLVKARGRQQLDFLGGTGDGWAPDGGPGAGYDFREIAGGITGLADYGVYGDLFTWPVIQQYGDYLCPAADGWRVPTATDFIDMAGSLNFVMEGWFVDKAVTVSMKSFYLPGVATEDSADIWSDATSKWKGRFNGVAIQPTYIAREASYWSADEVTSTQNPGWINGTLGATSLYKQAFASYSPDNKTFSPAYAASKNTARALRCIKNDTGGGGMIGWRK